MVRRIFIVVVLVSGRKWPYNGNRRLRVPRQILRYRNDQLSDFKFIVCLFCKRFETRLRKACHKTPLLGLLSHLLFVLLSLLERVLELEQQVRLLAGCGGLPSVLSFGFGDFEYNTVDPLTF